MDKLVRLGKILSDINRVKILALLQREKELCVCEICDTLELSQPLVSRHLKQMREANIVSAKKNGKWIFPLTKGTCVSHGDGPSMPKSGSTSTTTTEQNPFKSNNLL